MPAFCRKPVNHRFFLYEALFADLIRQTIAASALGYESLWKNDMIINEFDS